MKKFTKYSSLLVVVIFFIPLSSCTHKEERLKVSGVNSKFNFDTSKTFSEYISYSRKIIASGRVNLNSDNKDKIIAWNSPFTTRPNIRNCSTNNKKGILLIHGLTDSPYITRTMAGHFSKNCFTVYSILLAGHGTRPGDLLDVSYKDWVKQVEYGVKELSKEADKIYLGGFSTGGALAVNYVLSNPLKKIAGIIALSPALNLDTIASLSPVVKYFKKYNSTYEDKDLVKYESFAMNAAAQIYLLTKRISKKLKNNNKPLKNTPIFAALTYEDKTINAEKTLDTLLNNTSSKKRHIVVYHQYDLPINMTNHKNLYQIQSTIKKDQILDLAHISLPNNSHDIWYGKNGQYRNCLHYYDDRNKNQNYNLCQSSDHIYYGEITKSNLNKGITARLSYNPFIEKLFADLEKFFLQHSS